MSRLIDADALKKKYTMVIKRTSPSAIMERPAILLEDVDEAPTINEKKIIKDFLLKCSKMCNDDCDKCPMYIQRAYDEKLCFFDFFDNFQFLDNVRKMDDVITGVLNYETN